jgi:hypothetical protein
MVGITSDELKHTSFSFSFIEVSHSGFIIISVLMVGYCFADVLRGTCLPYIGSSDY